MILALRFFHIVAGIFWVGSSLFTARFIMPAFKAAGPAAGPVLAELGKRRIPAAMMGAALVNIISGIWLMAIDAAGQPGVWMRSGMGRTLGVGGALTIVALILGLTVAMPTTAKITGIGAAVRQRGGAPTAQEAADLERLNARSALVAMIAAALLFFAASAMAVARYVP